MQPILGAIGIIGRVRVTASQGLGVTVAISAGHLRIIKVTTRRVIENNSVMIEIRFI